MDIWEKHEIVGEVQEKNLSVYVNSVNCSEVVDTLKKGCDVWLKLSRRRKRSSVV